MADGKALVSILGTGDESDPRIGERTFTTCSATDLGGVDALQHLGCLLRHVVAHALQRAVGAVPDELDEALRLVGGEQ